MDLCHTAGAALEHFHPSVELPLPLPLPLPSQAPLRCSSAASSAVRIGPNLRYLALIYPLR